MIDSESCTPAFKPKNISFFPSTVIEDVDVDSKDNENDNEKDPDDSEIYLAKNGV